MIFSLMALGACTAAETIGIRAGALSLALDSGSGALSLAVGNTTVLLALLPFPLRPLTLFPRLSAVREEFEASEAEHVVVIFLHEDHHE